MQTSMYNFYCLKTLAKNFYRLNPTLSYTNYKVSLKPDINVSSISNIISNKLIVFDTSVQFKNKQFIETVMYFYPDKKHIGLRFVEPPEVYPPVRDISLNYNIDIFNNSILDSSLKFVHFFDNKELPTMNPYFWSNLSVENQTELNKIYELLNQIKDVNSNNNFIICK